LETGSTWSEISFGFSSALTGVWFVTLLRVVSLRCCAAKLRMLAVK
jgi:hypothetical protein